VACAFEPGDHGTTFGGSNLAVAAALATLTTLAEEGTMDRINAVGEHLRSRLGQIPGIEDVRGYGLMIGCDVPDANANEIVGDAIANGFLLNATGPHTLRFLPPLICTNADVDALMDKLPALVEGAVQA
jgi:acetylornithine aminotransferase